MKGKNKEGSSSFKNIRTRCTDDDREWFDCPKYNNKSTFYKVIMAAENIMESECHLLDISSEVRFESDSD